MSNEKIKVDASTTVEFTIHLKLTTGEAKALDAIVGYGHKAFLEVFYPKLGKAYLEPHEKEMINLFNKISKTLPKEIGKIEAAQKAINEAIQKFK